MPPFTVLMSLYDKEKPEYLSECLESIKQQSLLPSEIVIVFDGPVNSLLADVVDNYSRILPIIIVKLDVNQGLGPALNMGLQHCQNDLVARMDTDDICHHERFIQQISYMACHPNVAVIGSSIDEYDETMTFLIGRRITPISSEDIVKYARVRSPFNHMTVVFRKNMVLNAGGYIPHHFMEDYNLWLRIISLGAGFYNFSDSLVYARTGRSMISRRKGIKYLKSEFRLALLKHRLGFHNCFSAILVFFIRSVPRMFPNRLLTLVYQFIRR